MAATWIDSAGKVRRLRDLDPGYTFEDRPLAWQAAGLQQTASGYGRKLTSSRVVRLTNGRTRRVYITQFSNAGTAWVRIGENLYVVD